MLQISELNISYWERPVNLFAGGMVIFVAYEGFEVIANAVPDLINPQKSIARLFTFS